MYWKGKPMKFRDDLLKRIEKKEMEIRELEMQMAAANAYLQALQETVRLLPKDPLAGPASPAQVLRPGSAMARSREAILNAGKPLHITELLKALGRPVDKNSRVSLSGSLSAYVKRSEVFTRPAPNTFGLIELNHSEMPDDEPPANFGSLPDEEPETTSATTISDDDVPF